MPAAIMVALLRTPITATAALCGALLLVHLTRLRWDWVGRRLAWTSLFLLLFLVWLPFFPEPSVQTLDLGPLRLSVTGLERLVAVLLKTLAVVTLFLVLLASAPLYDTLKAALTEEGSGPFVWTPNKGPRAGESVEMSYWRLPEAALDDPELASRWAEKALAVARSKATAKPKAKKSRKV